MRFNKPPIRPIDGGMAREVSYILKTPHASRSGYSWQSGSYMPSLGIGISDSLVCIRLDWGILDSPVCNYTSNLGMFQTVQFAYLRLDWGIQTV